MQLKESGEAQVSTSNPEDQQIMVRNNITEVVYNVQTSVEAKNIIPIYYKCRLQLKLHIMKNSPFPFLTFLLCSISVFSQSELLFSQNRPLKKPVDSLNIWNYSPPFPSSENFIFSHSDFRWKPKTEYNFFNLSFFSGEFTNEVDLLTVNNKFFYIGGLSVMDTRGPYSMMYFLPFGFSLPLFNCKNLSLVLGNYYYLLPSHNNVPGHTKYFDNFHISEGSDLDIRFPRFIDNQIRIETNFIIGLSVFTGYRIQLSQYTVTNSSSNVVQYTSNSLNGFYAGISLNLGILTPMRHGIKRCYNIGQSKYRQLENSFSALQGFINEYPDEGKYTELAKQRLEPLKEQETKRKELEAQKIPNAIAAGDKIIPGITMEEVISLLQMGESLNRNIARGIFVGMGVFPQNADEKSSYTGDASLDGYDIVFEKGKVVSKKLVSERLGSKKANFSYAIKLGNEK